MPRKYFNLPNQVILINKYPGKPPKKISQKPLDIFFFFFDILPLFIFFSLSFPFYIRDDQSPKNSDGSTKELTINFPMITYWVVRATSLYHIKKWTSYPLYMALSYNPYGLCISFVNPKSRINTCQSLNQSTNTYLWIVVIKGKYKESMNDANQNGFQTKCLI